jgi:hypothetical protein
MARKLPVNVNTWERAALARADADQPFQLFLTFSQVSGPALTAGREAVVRMRLIELAGVLQSIPAIMVTDLADKQALARVQALLGRLDELRRLNPELET